MNKTVSIVVCTYNGEKYLREQLDSLINQTYPIKEIIVQDDGSSDSTMSILKEYEQKHPFLFKIYKNENNLFWNQNFYSAILKANGDYIALCDQDDIWDSRKVEKQISDIAPNKLIHVCSSYKWYGETTTPFLSKMVSIPEICFHYCYCGHQMLLSSEIKKYVPIGQKADMAHDKFFSIIGICLDILQTSEECLVKWRRHPNSSTGNFSVENISGTKRIIKCLQELLLHQKSIVIERACKKYYDVLDYASQYANTPPQKEQIDTLRNLYAHLGKQTLLSYFHASIIILFNAKKVIPTRTITNKSIKTRISRHYNNFVWAYKWWHLHKNDL